MANFHQIWPGKVFKCPVAEFGNIFENFQFRGICHQNLKSKIGQRGTSLRAGYRSQNALQRDTGTVYPSCNPRVREFLRSGQLSPRTYSCGATGRQSCPIFGFWPIFPIQNPWKVPSGDQPTFPPNIFAPPSKSPQNPILGACKSHANGATKV